MKKERIAGHSLEIYESVEEMPMRKYHKFNKFLLLDAGIGSDMSGVDQHLARVSGYVGKNDKKALAELNNLRQGIFLILEGVNVKHKSFAALIHSIDGKVVHRLTDEKVDQITEMLGSAPTGIIDRLIESVKKKIDAEQKALFPEQFNDTGMKNVYQSAKDRLYQRAMQVADGIDRAEKISELEDFLDSEDKMKKFYGKENFEIEYDKAFERACNYITQKLGVEVSDETTIYDFYNKLEFSSDGK